MRTLGLVALLCVACTRPNPGFEGEATTADEDAGEPITSDPDTVGLDTVGPGTVGSGLETSGSVTASSGVDSVDPDTVGIITTTAAEDLPGEPSCEEQPSPGLSIQVANPEMSGGFCPPTINFAMRFVSAEGNELMVEPCLPGCDMCFGELYPLFVDLIALGDILPMETCLSLEAQPLVNQTETRCHWGALTIWEPALGSPHVIATSRSHPPTPIAAGMLAGTIPEPMEDPPCTCASIGQDDACCNAGDPPTFLYYAIGDQEVHPGDDAPIELPIGFEHSFQLFQAEHIPACTNEERQLSWAVVSVP